MTIEEINNTVFNVTILNCGRDGDTLRYKVHNNIIGDFEINNCYYNTDPAYFPNAQYHLNGSTSLTLSDNNTYNFIAILTICYDNTANGQVILRC